MKRFEKVPLGSVADIRGGKRLPNGADFVARPTAHPYIRARDIGQGKVQIEEPVYLSDEVARRLARYTVNAGDVCLTIVGANVGDMGAVPIKLDGANLTENAVKIVSNGKSDQTYLKYALLTGDALAQMKVLAGGAAQPKLGIYKVETIEIPLPPLQLQRRIAGILSAYDELIENNQKRIKILEEMARSLYREWFVHFRFPGHDKVKMLPSSLGPIPQGWEVLPLEVVCDRITDGAHHSPKSVKDGFPMASVKDMEDWGFNLQGCRRISEQDYDNLVRNNCKPKKGDVLIAKDGSYLKHTFVVGEDQELVILSSIAILRPNARISANYLNFTLRNPETKARMKGFVSGVALPRIILKDFRNFHIVVAPDKIQIQWAKQVDPMVESCRKLTTRNENLRRTRDLLLPRLLSGQIELKSMEAVA